MDRIAFGTVPEDVVGASRALLTDDALWRESVEKEVRLESQIPDTVAVKHQLDQRDLAQISKSKLAHFTSCQNLPVF